MFESSLKLYLVCFVFLSFPPLSFAEGEESVKTSDVFSAEEQEDAREALKKLGVAFGVEQPIQSEEPTKPEEKDVNKEPVATKSIADVADKALDLTTSFVTKISAKMEQVAPKIWEVMIRQQYAKAIGDLVLPLGLIIVFLCILIFSIPIKRRYRETYEGKISYVTKDNIGLTSYGWYWFFFTLVPVVLLLFFGIWFFVSLTDSAMYLINPEYYAVRDLLKMLLAPGTV